MSEYVGNGTVINKNGKRTQLDGSSSLNQYLFVDHALTSSIQEDDHHIPVVVSLSTWHTDSQQGDKKKGRTRRHDMKIHLERGFRRW